MPTWYEALEDELVRAYNAGEMTQTEYNKAMRDLSRDVRDAMREEAQSAYDAVTERY